MENYVVLDIENEVYGFFQKFRQYIDKNKLETAKDIDLDAVRFASNNRAGTNNKRSILSRFNFILSKFLEWYPNVKLKDEKRNFNEFQRIAIFRRDKGKCQNPVCGIDVPYNNFHADHIIPHSRGGPTIISNGQVLCSKCNEKKANNPDIGY